MTDTERELRPLVYHHTGEYRFRFANGLVILEVREATRPYQPPKDRWRDATPNDLLARPVGPLRHPPVDARPPPAPACWPLFAAGVVAGFVTPRIAVDLAVVWCAAFGCR